MNQPLNLGHINRVKYLQLVDRSNSTGQLKFKLYKLPQIAKYFTLTTKKCDKVHTIDQKSINHFESWNSDLNNYVKCNNNLEAKINKKKERRNQTKDKIIKYLFSLLLKTTLLYYRKN